MRCPRCNFQHNEDTGRLIALAPTFGLRKEPARKVSIVASQLHPNEVDLPERIVRVDAGYLVRCLNCGHPFGVDKEGAFTPMLEPPQEKRVMSDGPPLAIVPKNPPREPHLLDDDIPGPPEMD